MNATAKKHLQEAHDLIWKAIRTIEGAKSFEPDAGYRADIKDALEETERAHRSLEVLIT